MGKDSLFLFIHINNCLITSTSSSLIKAFKIKMNQKYKLTDLGPVEWLLGIKVTQNCTEQTILLSQDMYINSIITQFNFNNLKPSSIPMNLYIVLSKSQCPMKFTDIQRMKHVPYHEAVGSLNYTTMETCTDIKFAVSTVT